MESYCNEDLTHRVLFRADSSTVDMEAQISKTASEHLVTYIEFPSFHLRFSVRAESRNRELLYLKQ